MAKKLKLGNDLINAVKEIILNTSYPVGRIIVSIDNVNPGTYLGGTWVSFGKGRTLVGVDTSQTEFNTVEKTGGEKTHKLTVNELPKHQPSALLNTHDSSTRGSAINWQVVTNGRYYSGDMFKTIGNDQPHNNLQPYITTYFWKRTA